MIPAEEINVMIGEVRTGTNNERLQAILGSCIGIALIDVQMGLCSLSHSLLPFSDTADPQRPGRWVNQAIYAAIDLLNVAPGRTRRLHAVVAGGGCMIEGKQSRMTDIGRSNRESAIKVLEELKINIVAQDIGGYSGRKISICTQSLDYKIEKIPRTSTTEATL